MHDTRESRASRSRAGADSYNHFIRVDEVSRLVALSRSTLWRLERQGKFPARRQLSARAVGWLIDEVEAWIAARTRASAETGGTFHEEE